MNVPIRCTSAKKESHWHERFLAMMPAIRRQAAFAFRHLGKDARDEAIAEVIAHCLVAYARVIERGRQAIAYPTTLARFAVAQIHGGRRVGSGQNKNDVLAGVARGKCGIGVESLDRLALQRSQWLEATLEDKRTPVAEQAAFRCDFPAWLATHSPRDRQIAERLSLGHSTQEVARQFRLTAGRISQLRREFHDSWQKFHGEFACERTATIAAA